MREFPILSPDCCISPPSERFTKKVPNVGVQKKFQTRSVFGTNFTLVSLPTNYAEDTMWLSSGLGYRVQCSRLMALRMLREEAARRLEHEPRGTVVNVLLKFRPLFPMPHMPLELPRFHGS
jgi:hypothetical protein